jgi:hypothetical protein
LTDGKDCGTSEGDVGESSQCFSRDPGTGVYSCSDDGREHTRDRCISGEDDVGESPQSFSGDPRIGVHSSDNGQKKSREQVGGPDRRTSEEDDVGESPQSFSRDPGIRVHSSVDDLRDIT